mmetsp:Transcript_9912/g.11218  ORF Transcript_9912/g.11218 Transcript_9912/m.11218 type:complete len:88 (+) Transcript_9912:19-282(+)
MEKRNHTQGKRSSEEQNNKEEYFSTFKIASSAFSKVISKHKDIELFKSLPSLLKLSNNLSANKIENKLLTFEDERDQIFQNLYSEVK